MAPAATASIRLLCAALCALPLAQPVLAGVTVEQMESPLGTLHLVHPEDAPKGLVLFLPGTRGWDREAEARAREVAGQGHLVAALDWSGRSQTGQSGSCWDLSKDLANLALWVDGKEALPHGALPTLMGESEGASLVYVALLQSPPHRFHAALTLGFCPRWPTTVPPCRVEGLNDGLIEGDRLEPAPRVPSGWFLLDGPNPGCTVQDASAFADRVANARLTSGSPSSKPPSDSGDDLSPLASLMQWLDPRIPDQVGVSVAEADIAGLPLVEVRAPQEDPSTFAVMLSGDGGWAALDRGVTAELAAKGMSTVGWDSLSYFWKARTPEEVARDLGRVLRHYLSAWHKKRAILVGYSFGADALPFIANALPADLRQRVSLAAFLGLGRTAMFEFHLSDWLDTGRGADALPVLPQLQALDWTRGLCIYGEDEEESLCPDLAKLGIAVHRVPGDHHFDGDYPGVGDLILKAAATPSKPVEGAAAAPP